MSIIDFASDAGEAVRLTADAITEYVASLGLAGNLEFHIGAGGRIAVSGSVPSKPDREKVVVAVGNIAGVCEVEDDNVTVDDDSEPDCVYYTVQPGDTLSHIAQQFYGRASEYMRIFNANRPMLRDPDLIYPKQVLRIPQ